MTKTVHTVWLFKAPKAGWIATPVTRGRHPVPERISEGRRTFGQGRSQAAALAELAKALKAKPEDLRVEKRSDFSKAEAVA